MKETNYTEEYKKTLALDVTWTPNDTNTLLERACEYIDWLRYHFYGNPFRDHQVFHIEDAQFNINSLIGKLIRVPDKNREDVEKTLEILQKYKKKADFIAKF